MDALEAQIADWRIFAEQASSVNESDIDELEDHLRVQITDLVDVGLAHDEAFLVAIKRMGKLDDLSREFAHEYSGRLWRQIALSGDEQQGSGGGWILALGFAVAAAATIEFVLLAAGYPAEEPTWLVRNAGVVVLPFLAGFFAVQRRLTKTQIALTGTAFVVSALAINLYPFTENSTTELLVALHLPVLLWLALAYPYTGAEPGTHEKRMDFVRFTGEWFLYYALIALGGGVLLGLTAVILEPTGANAERIVEWVLPAGSAGAAVVAAWLVEAKQRVVENMAPVLTMIFTPLFAVMLATALVVYIATGFGDAFDRELLGTFDILLIVVLGLVLYGLSARDPNSTPGWMDHLRLLTVVAALILDIVILVAMFTRIAELGFTPNRTAALGLNVLLLANLAGTAWLSMRANTGKETYHTLEKWQMSYLPVFAVWAATVVFLLPPIFAFA